MQNFWGPKCHSSWVHEGVQRGGEAAVCGAGLGRAGTPAASGFLPGPAASSSPATTRRADGRRSDLEVMCFYFPFWKQQRKSSAADAGRSLPVSREVLVARGNILALSACEILKPGCCSNIAAWHDCATGPGEQLPAQRSPSRAAEPGLALLGAPAHGGSVLVGPETSAPFVFLPHSCRLPC